MKTLSRDLLVLIDGSLRVKQSVESLTFVPALRVRHLPAVPDPDTTEEEPLVYLVGEGAAGLETPESLNDWMDRLRAAEGAPVALVLPREGYGWCSATTHPQYCGLLPVRPELSIGAMERVLHGARQNLARRQGQQTMRRGSLSWCFTTSEAADPEQAWLLLESSLAALIGCSADLSCLGMAFAEALTNAVEHGNLELESSMKDRPDAGLFDFFEERDRRLADPVYARRRVWVDAAIRGTRMRVRIRNEGRGFDPAALDGPVLGGSDIALSHGLGLAMIRSLVDSVRISSDGRNISLFHRIPRSRIRSLGVLPNLLGEEIRRPAA